MAELGFWLWGSFVLRKRGVEGEFTEGDDDAEVELEELEFAGEEGAALLDFVQGGFVVGRGAVDGGGDVAVDELEAVVSRHGGGLVGEACAVEGAVEPVAATVSGEDAASSVAAVGSGGEADDEESGVGGAEAGDGFAPVGFGGESFDFVLGDLFAPLDEAGAGAAGDDFLEEEVQGVGGLG